jgi:ABC-type branched-subunit amino acid transport system ATPase component
MSKLAAPALEARNLSHHYGAVHAVRGVDLAVQSGELLAMIGPNGAGKSTVFSLLAGDMPCPTSQISLAGVAIERLSVQARAAAGLGRTFQTAAPFASLSVLDNLRVAATALPAQAQQRLAALPQLLHDSGLAALQHEAVQNLPYADWKRLDLALALAQQPRVLLLDEPTAGLAPEERHAMMHWVQRLAREQGLAVLFTEHNLDAVFAYASQVLVLVRGRVIAQGTPQVVANDPQVQAAYTGGYAMPATP